MRYFRSGSQAVLLKQIKEHLADGVRSYQNSLKVTGLYIDIMIKIYRLFVCDILHNFLKKFDEKADDIY